MLNVDKRALPELLESIYEAETFYRDVDREKAALYLMSPEVIYTATYEGEKNRPAFDHVD